ncbi:MAG: type II toxin-antitoxin system VapC family toxin [Thermoprotei archaeon]
MKIFIDTPLLIYLNTMADSSHRIVYENFYIEILTRYKPFTDVLVLDELLYISKKKYNIPYDVTIEFIESNVLPYVSVLSLGENEYNQAVNILKKYQLKPSDAIHVGAMLANDISLIASEDREYDKIEGIKRTWIY